MKRNPHYHHINIGNKHVLYPDTAGVTLGLKPVTLNNTGAFLWENASDCDRAALVQKAVSCYDVTADEVEALSLDINAFIDSMYDSRAFINDVEVSGQKASDKITSDKTVSNETVSIEKEYEQYTVGGIALSFSCVPALTEVLSDMLSRYFDRFRTTVSTGSSGCNKTNAHSGIGSHSDGTGNTDKPVQHIFMDKATPFKDCCSDNLPPAIFESNEISMYDAGERYCLRFGSEAFNFLDCILVTKDFEKVTVCLNTNDIITESLFLSLRFPFMLKAATENRYMLHSSSLLYRDRVFCFSAPSGTGKSTHTNMWQKLFGSVLINGDLNLIGFDEPGGEYLVYGTPWCGTSGICDPEVRILGGIVFIKRSHIPAAEEIPYPRNVLATANRLISPSLGASETHAKFDFLDKMCSSHKIITATLHANMEDETALLMRSFIDNTVSCM